MLQSWTLPLANVAHQDSAHIPCFQWQQLAAQWSSVAPRWLWKAACMPPQLRRLDCVASHAISTSQARRDGGGRGGARCRRRVAPELHCAKMSLELADSACAAVAIAVRVAIKWASGHPPCAGWRIRAWTIFWPLPLLRSPSATAAIRKFMRCSGWYITLQHGCIMWIHQRRVLQRRVLQQRGAQAGVPGCWSRAASVCRPGSVVPGAGGTHRPAGSGHPGSARHAACITAASRRGAWGVNVPLLFSNARQ